MNAEQTNGYLLYLYCKIFVPYRALALKFSRFKRLSDPAKMHYINLVASATKETKKVCKVVEEFTPLKAERI